MSELLEFSFLALFIWLAYVVSRRTVSPNPINKIRYRRLAKAWMNNQLKISKWLYDHRELFDGDINKALSHPTVRPLLAKSRSIYSRMVAINPALGEDEELTRDIERYVRRFTGA